MEFLRSLLRRRFARAQVATSRDVGCFLRISVPKRHSPWSRDHIQLFSLLNRVAWCLRWVLVISLTYVQFISISSTLYGHQSSTAALSPIFVFSWQKVPTMLETTFVMLFCCSPIFVKLERGYLLQWCGLAIIGFFVRPRLVLLKRRRTEPWCLYKRRLM